MSRRLGTRILAGPLLVALVVAACGSSEPDTTDDLDASGEPSSGATGRPGIPIFGPRESYEPVEVTLNGTLPRSAAFLGVRFTVTAAHVTNVHPYTIFGEPRPGAQLFAVVEVTAENETQAATEYTFNDEAFSLRTYSGQVLPTVAAPGVYDFSRLEPGESGTDELVFGAYLPDVLEGASLVIGRSPDAPTILPLTAPQHDPAYPMAVLPATDEPVQAGSIAWTVLDGEASLDRPAGVCCPETGARADDGELFVTLSLSGRVSGSRYGQASITSDAVRLVVDGTSLEAFGFKGKANVPEGSTYDFDQSWLIDAAATTIELELGSGTPDARRLELGIGTAPLRVEVPPSPAPSMVPSPGPSAASSASPPPAPSASSSSAPPSASPAPS